MSDSEEEIVVLQSDDLTNNPTAGQPSLTCSAVLRNDDLLHIIFRMLKSIVLESQDSDDLVAQNWKNKLVPLLAVNRVFNEAAIQVIWDTMHSFLPLFCLLPSFVARDIGYTFGGIRDEEWIRFNIYARRIKHFKFQQQCPFEELSAHWLSFLFSRMSLVGPLLPSLRSISCSYQARGALGIIPLAMGPSLESLNVSLGENYGDGLVPPPRWESAVTAGTPADNDHLLALAGTIAYRAQRLVELHYLGPVSKQLMLSFSQLQDLTRLTLTATSIITPDDISPIIQLAPLKQLKLVLLSNIPLTKLQVKLQMGKRKGSTGRIFEPPVLPILSDLSDLEIITPSANLWLLQNQLNLTHLQRLTIRLSNIETLYLRDLTEYLERNTSLAEFTVQHLDLNSAAVVEDKEDVSSYARVREESLIAVLSQRIANGNMHTLRILGTPVFTGARIAKAIFQLTRGFLFSNLEVFQYHHSPKVLARGSRDFKYMATMELLKDLTLTGCKTLKHLELMFTDGAATQVPPTPSQTSNHGLEILGIMTPSNELQLSMDQKISVAIFLHNLFPSLQTVHGTDRATWKDVNALVLSYQRNSKATIEAFYRSQPVMRSIGIGEESVSTL